jgi:protein-L-isoaspartate O-methyltransferase
MPEAFWIQTYAEKARDPDVIVQSGRGRQFGLVELLHLAGTVLRMLELRPHHDLVDVGCGNGLLDIVLSAACRRVLALEPVEELAAHARLHLKDCTNVEVSTNHGAAIPSADHQFDRGLVSNVLQLVKPPEAVRMFEELRRVMRPSGRILFGSVPDARGQADFSERYLRQVDAATHLTERQKAEIHARQAAASWYDPAQLATWWRARGAQAEWHPLPVTDPNSDHRFHLLVTLPS